VAGGSQEGERGGRNDFFPAVSIRESTNRKEKENQPAEEPTGTSSINKNLKREEKEAFRSLNGGDISKGGGGRSQTSRRRTRKRFGPRNQEKQFFRPKRVTREDGERGVKTGREFPYRGREEHGKSREKRRCLRRKGEQTKVFN